MLSVDCVKIMPSETLLATEHLLMAYLVVCVFGDGEETGNVFITEGSSGGEVIVLGHHLDTWGRRRRRKRRRRRRRRRKEEGKEDQGEGGIGKGRSKRRRNRRKRRRMAIHSCNNPLSLSLTCLLTQLSQ